MKAAHGESASAAAATGANSRQAEQNRKEMEVKRAVSAPSQRQSVPGLLRRAAQQTGTLHVATVAEDGTTQSYRQMLSRVERLAAGLRHACGLRDGARVGILALNSPDYLELLFAVPWARGVAVALNTRLAGPEVADIVADAEAEVLFVDAACAGSAAHALQAPCCVKTVVVVGSAAEAASARPLAADFGGAWLSTELLLSHAPDSTLERDAEASPCGDDVYGLYYTGGTTGKAKGVMLSHGSIVTNARLTMGVHAFSRLSRYLHCAPMFHLADAQMCFSVTLACATHVFVPRFTPQATLRAIAERKVSHVVMVPVMLRLCLEALASSAQSAQSAQSESEAKSGDEAVSSLEAVIYGGAPMAPSLLRRCIEAFPRAKFFQGYGQTECGAGTSMLMPEDHDPAAASFESRLASAGRPLPHVEVRIVAPDGSDPADAELARGQVGEIISRGPCHMRGYWKQPEATAAALLRGWLRSGDGGYMDDDGYVFVVSRIKDMIVSGGENVYPAEVEAALADFPGLRACAVIGTPDATFGEAVTAIVVMEEPNGPNVASGVAPAPGVALVPGVAPAPALEAVRQHCKAKIAGFKCPRRVEVRAALPMSGAGKVLKHHLRADFWKGQEMARTFCDKSG